MKVRQILQTILVNVMVGLVLTAIVIAQQPQEKKSQQSRQHDKETMPMGKMSMDEMMKQCMQHHQSAIKSIDEMTKMMEGAKQSNDPAKMRSAIDQSEKQLVEMKEHMTMCTNMMSMMEKMQGMDGMMKGHSK